MCGSWTRAEVIRLEWCKRALQAESYYILIVYIVAAQPAHASDYQQYGDGQLSTAHLGIACDTH